MTSRDNTIDFEIDETTTDEFDMYLANKTSVTLILKAYNFFP
jgi:hypothetical protein